MFTMFCDGRPVFLEIRSSTWFITVTVCTAIFTDIFLYAVIVPVFPFSLQHRIGVPEEDVQHWLSVLLAVYGVGLLVGAPICGILADRTKYRKWPLLVGLIAVLGATLLLCLAKTLPLLILGRLIQGLSASVIWVVGLALLADTVGGEGIAVSMGYIGTAYSLGTLIAPLLGGIVYQKSGYYAVFAMTFGVIGLDIILRLTMIEKKAARRWFECDDDPGRDAPPQVASEVQTHVKAQDGSSQPFATRTATHDVEKSGALQDVSGTQAHAKRKLPAIMTLMASRRMLAAFWGNLAGASMVTGLDTTLTLFVSRTFGWNSLSAGVLFLAPLLPSFFSPVVGKYVDKYGSRWIGTFGFLFMIPFYVLLRLVDHDSVEQKVLLVALLVLVGIGFACSLTSLIAEFTKICDAKEKAHPGTFGTGGAYAQSYGIFNISWAAGSVIGAFWSGGVYSAAGWGTVTWTWALLAGVSALPVMLFTDGWIGKTCIGRLSTGRGSG